MKKVADIKAKEDIKKTAVVHMASGEYTLCNTTKKAKHTERRAYVTCKRCLSLLPEEFVTGETLAVIPFIDQQQPVPVVPGDMGLWDVDDCDLVKLYKCGGFSYHVHEEETIEEGKRPNGIYNDFQFAYDFFNKQLFNNELPDCMVTMERDHRFAAYYHGDTWRRANKDGVIVDQITMNAVLFDVRDPFQTLSTLVHEMCHQQRHHFRGVYPGMKGKRANITKPPRGGYHCKVWARMMHSVGLQPKSLDKPGKETGQSVTHTIKPDGKFAVACLNLLVGHNFKITYYDNLYSSLRERYTGKGNGVTITITGGSTTTGPNPKNRSNRTKYVCEKHGYRTWGKGAKSPICPDCAAEILAPETFQKLAPAFMEDEEGLTYIPEKEAPAANDEAAHEMAAA